jgi:hypothetical protein
MDAIRAALYEILAGGHPMTVRQVFYAATTRGVVAKTEAEYKGTVCRLLAEMRREGEIPYIWLADATRWMRRPTTYSSAEAALKRTAETYRRALWDDSEVAVEIWLEKEALAGVLVDVTVEWDVPLMVTRGYPSMSFLHSAAEAIRSREAEGQQTKIYYFGDRDPSGADIDRAVVHGIGESLAALEKGAIDARRAEKAEARFGDDPLARSALSVEELLQWFCSLGELTESLFNGEPSPPSPLMEDSDFARQLRRHAECDGLDCVEGRTRCDFRSECRPEWCEETFGEYVTFTRVAVTEDQIEEWNLPTRPTKKTDTRSKSFKGESVELDAVSADRLRELARNCIERHVDQHQLGVLQKTEEEERRLLLEMVEGFNGGAS